MERRQLGKNGLSVSAIGLGCMGMVGWYGTRDDAEALSTVDRALELGVDFLDTADIYQSGENERFVGQAIRGRRDKFVVATKFGYMFEEGATRAATMTLNGSPAYVKRAVEGSLKRLGTDVIDLYYLHRADRNVPIEDTVGAMADLVKAGKIRHIGLSEVSSATLRRAHAVHPIAALQTEYSLWTRDPEAEILPLCRELGIGFVSYSPLGRGFLTGAIDDPAKLPADDARQRHPRFAKENVALNRKIVATVEELARAKDCTPAQLAIAWVMASGKDVVPIPGTKRRRYLEDNLGALKVILTKDDLAKISAAFPPGSAAGARYPEGMMANVNG